MRNFEKDLETIDLSDDKLAQEIYAALCNVAWYDKDNVQNIYTCSWRYAGGLISRIRNEKHNKMENYLDYYCSGIADGGVAEGTITTRVLEIFTNLGWKQHLSYFSDVE